MVFSKPRSHGGRHIWIGNAWLPLNRHQGLCYPWAGAGNKSFGQCPRKKVKSFDHSGHSGLGVDQPDEMTVDMSGIITALYLC